MKELTRKDVIDQSIKALIGIAQTLSLGAKAIEGIVDSDFVDAEVYLLTGGILEEISDCHDSIEQGIKDLQVKAIYDFEGSTCPTDCFLCGAEMVEVDEDRFVCPSCGHE